MSRTLAIAALCALAAGCAHRTPVITADADLPSRPPLTARLLAPQYGTLRFDVSRAAHVAVFEIIPGRGTSLLYPTAGWQESRVEGLHQAHLAGFIPGRDYYHRNASPAMARYASIEPRYLLLIASERPLRLRDIQRSPAALQRRLGFAKFSGFGVAGTMNALAELVVPDVDAGDWAYDYWMLVPPAPAQRHAASRVSCYDPTTGALYIMPAYFGLTGLLGVPTGNLCPGVARADARPLAVDSSVVRPKEAPKPGHREPIPLEFRPRVAERADPIERKTTIEPLDDDATRRIAEDSKLGIDHDRGGARIEREADPRTARDRKVLRRGADAPPPAGRAEPRDEPPARVERRSQPPTVEKRVERAEPSAPMRAEPRSAPRAEPRARGSEGRPAPVRAEPKKN